MNTTVTYNFINKVLTKELGIKKDIIHNHSGLYMDLGLNETELAILLFYIENHFHMEIPSEEINQKTTLCDLIKLVQKTNENVKAIISVLNPNPG